VKLLFAVLAVKLPDGLRLSHVVLVHVCSVACTVALVVVGAVIVSVRVAGGTAPATALKLRETTFGESCVVAPGTTVMTTFTVRTPEAATVEMVPLHVVPAAIPD
jgi:hypothetical protein